MQYKTASPSFLKPENPWKQRLTRALERGAQQLQTRTNKWSPKTRLTSLLLFLTLSGGTSLSILITSISRESSLGVLVTPIRSPKYINRAEGFKHWPSGPKKGVSAPGHKGTTGALSLPKEMPAQPVLQPSTK